MNKLKYIIFGMFLLFMFHTNVYASSVSVKASNGTIYRGETVTITATVSADSGIYTVSGSVYCSGAGVNQGIELSYEDMNTASKSLTRSVKITPSSSGTVTCKSADVKIRELAKESEYSIGSSSVIVTVKNRESSSGTKNNSSSNNNSNSGGGTTADKKEYDSDNTLKSLEIVNYKLDPSFNKDTVEYKLEVDESVEKINVKAVANSDKAEVKGVGEKNLTPGENTVEVKVIAENGNEKVYKVLVMVKDQHPISVMIENKKYTVVKKNNNILEKLEYYDEEVIKIDNQDVISYYNKNTKVRLVILKDDENKAGYYVYQDTDDKYKKYRFITVGNITLQLLDMVGKLEHYKKYEIDIKNEKVDIYKVRESSNVGIIYGTNVKSGNTGYYVYDTNEDTLSKYYDEDVKIVKGELNDVKNQAMLFMGIAAGITIVTILVSIIRFIRGRKKAINYR